MSVCPSVPADAASLCQSDGATIPQFIYLNAREMEGGKYEEIVKGKGKVQHRTGHEGPEEKKRHSSTLSLISALDGGGWSTPRPGRFTPGKESRCSLYRRLGGPRGRSGRMQKISPQPGFDPRTVQPIASRYTNCAISAH